MDNFWSIITEKNIKNEKIILKTNFNYDKINSLFSNISTLNLFELLI